MRMIDADLFIKHMRDYCYVNYVTKKIIDTLSYITNVEAEFHSVEAVPVKRGKWTVTPTYIKCSECGESFMLIPQNYCPNCGADMRGEQDG